MQPFDSSQRSLLIIFIISLDQELPIVPKHLLFYALPASLFLLQQHLFDFYLLHTILSFPLFAFNILLPSSGIPLAYLYHLLCFIQHHANHFLIQLYLVITYSIYGMYIYKFQCHVSIQGYVDSKL